MSEDCKDTKKIRPCKIYLAFLYYLCVISHKLS